MRWAQTGVVALLLAALAACGGSSSHPGTTAPPNGGQSAEHTRLLAAAHLQPCPTSSATPAPGGLPDVTLDCLGHGPQVHLAGLTGQPTVVNLWGAWCVPCQREASYLSSTYDTVRGRVRFLGVDIEDSDDNALDFSAKVTPPIHYPSVVDPDKTVLDDLHFLGPPETLLLDSAGTIVHVQHGEYTSAAAVRADLAKYLHVSV